MPTLQLNFLGSTFLPQVIQPYKRRFSNMNLAFVNDLFNSWLWVLQFRLSGSNQFINPLIPHMHRKHIDP